MINPSATWKERYIQADCSGMKWKRDKSSSRQPLLFLKLHKGPRVRSVRLVKCHLSSCKAWQHSEGNGLTRGDDLIKHPAERLKTEAYSVIGIFQSDWHKSYHPIWTAVPPYPPVCWLLAILWLFDGFRAMKYLYIFQGVLHKSFRSHYQSTGVSTSTVNMWQEKQSETPNYQGAFASSFLSLQGYSER